MAVKKKECRKCGYQNKLNAKKCFNCDADLTLSGRFVNMIVKIIGIGFVILVLIGAIIEGFK